MNSSQGTAATLLQLLLARASYSPSSLAIRWETGGVWKGVSWREYAEEIHRFALGLRQLGIGPSDRVALIARPTPEWLYADLAIQVLRAVPAAIHEALPTHEMTALLSYLKPRLLLVDAGQLRKLRTWPGTQRLSSSEAPSLERVASVPQESAPMISTFAEISELGSRTCDGVERTLADLVVETDPAEGKIIAYTAGWRGSPKGVVLRADNLRAQWLALCEWLGEQRPCHMHRLLVSLSLANICSRMVTELFPLLQDAVVYFAEDPDNLTRATRQIRPTMALDIPSEWERLGSQIEVHGWEARRLGRRMFGLDPTGKAIEEIPTGRDDVHEPVREFRRSVMMRARSVNPILRQLGYDRLRIALVGGASLSPAAKACWRRLGIDLREFYGLTEAGGAIAIEQAGTCSGLGCRAIPGLSVRVGSSGEILLDNPFQPFECYVDPQDSGVFWEGDGLLRLDDYGRMSLEGTLAVIGRKHGPPVGTTPATADCLRHAQNLLISVPGVRRAIVLEGGLGGLQAIIEPDRDGMALLARKTLKSSSSTLEPISNEEVWDILHRDIISVTRKLYSLTGSLLSSVAFVRQPRTGYELSMNRELRATWANTRYLQLESHEVHFDPI